MTGHRQEMFTIELTVGEIQEAVERRILEKYKFLTREDGWECQEIGFHEKNLNSLEPNSKGASGFYIKEIPVVEDAPLAEKKSQYECENFLKPCR
jgi:hypothetical protein